VIEFTFTSCCSWPIISKVLNNLRVWRWVDVEMEFGISFSFWFSFIVRVSVRFFEISHCSILSEKFFCRVQWKWIIQSIVNLSKWEDKTIKWEREYKWEKWKVYRIELNVLCFSILNNKTLHNRSLFLSLVVHCRSSLLCWNWKRNSILNESRMRNENHTQTIKTQ
jgi:hypothetical protein